MGTSVNISEYFSHFIYRERESFPFATSVKTFPQLLSITEVIGFQGVADELELSPIAPQQLPL